MPDSPECLMGQLITGVSDLRDEMKDLKVEVKELKVEMKKDTSILSTDVDSLKALRDKGAGILLATGVFFAFVGWCVSHFFSK